jgi:hypothetical protein
MFDVKTAAELRNINLRVESHGENMVRAMDIKLMLLDVPVSKLTSAIPDFEKRFYDGEQPILQEISPFQIQHKIENVEATIDNTKLTGADIKKGARCWHKPGFVCNLEIIVQASDFNDAALTALSKHIKEEVKCSITERQTKLPGMEQ